MEAVRLYVPSPYTNKVITSALGIANGTVTADKKLFTSTDISYDPFAEKWVNGDDDLDPKVKARFDKMTKAEWIAHLTEAKKEKLVADKAARRTKEKGKHRHQEHQSGSKKRKRDTDGSPSMGSEEEEEVLRRAEEIRQRKARKASRQVAGGGNGEGPSRSKGRRGDGFDSDELDRADSSDSS